MKDCLCVVVVSSFAFAGQKIRIATFNCEFLIKTITADLIVLTEIRGTYDFNAIVTALANSGLSYHYAELCDSSDPIGQRGVLLDFIAY